MLFRIVQNAVIVKIGSAHANECSLLLAALVYDISQCKLFQTPISIHARKALSTAPFCLVRLKCNARKNADG